MSKVEINLLLVEMISKDRETNEIDSRGGHTRMHMQSC